MFSGSLVALVTPLKDNNLDIPALGKLIDWQVDSGTDGIVVCGSTGEGLLLTDEERTKVISVAIEVANKRVPIIVGCSACATTEALRLVHIAEDLRADGALVVAPYYLKPTQAGIIEHFSCVRKNSNLPVIMYNNPGRCAVNMSIDTIVNLAKLGGMALKDSDPNLARVTVLAEVVPDLKLLSGDDPTLPGYLAHGGHGCISVTANIAPALVKKLITSWQYRDIETMQETGKKLAKLSEALFVESNPIPAKYILSKMGYVANELRSPLTPASLQTQQKINQDYTFWYDIQTTRQ